MDAPEIFDEHGLPTGQVAEAAWHSLLLRIEQQIDEQGWDQPTQLLGVSTPAYAHAELGEMGIDDVEAALAARSEADETGEIFLHQDERLDPHQAPTAEQVAALVDPDRERPSGPPDAFSVPMIVGTLDEFGDHPVQALWGRTVGRHVAAVILAFEGWSYPEDLEPDFDGPPSAHPRRVEMRSLYMLTRSGQAYAVLRHRGNSAEIMDDPPIGIVINVLRRILELPADDLTCERMYTPAQVLGTMAMTRPMTMLMAATGKLPDLSRLREQGVAADDLLDMREVYQQATQVAEGLSPDQYKGAALATFVHSAAALVWEATDHGKRHIDKPQVKALRDFVHGRDEHLELPPIAELLTSVGAKLTWAELASGKHSSALVPPGLTAVDWAGEELAGELVRTKLMSDSQEQRLRILAAIAGPEVATMLYMFLNAIGWAAVAPDELRDVLDPDALDMLDQQDETDHVAPAAALDNEQAGDEQGGDVQGPAATAHADSDQAYPQEPARRPTST